MIKCIICGIEKEYSIVEHLKFVHNMTSKEYKEKYNLEVRSEEFKKNTSKHSKNVWLQKGYKEKMSDIQKKSHSTKEFKEKQSKKLKKYYEEGGKTWNDGLTKDLDIRLKSIGEKNRKRIKGSKNPEHSLRLKKVWEKIKEENPEKLIEYNRKKSETICRLISENKNYHLGYNQYKRGYYKEFYFASSYEEKFMIFLDSCDKIKDWTNKHGIVIRYLDSEGINRGYIPDFKLELINGDILIIEIKAEKLINDVNVQLKLKAATKIYDNNYYLLSTTDELKEIIDGRC